MSLPGLGGKGFDTLPLTTVRFVHAQVCLLSFIHIDRDELDIDEFLSNWG